MKSLKRLNKVFFTLYIALQVGLVIFLSNLFIFTRLTYAWQTSQSAEAVCVSTSDGSDIFVKIRVHFINKEDIKSVNVTAVDNQTGRSIEFPTLRPGEVHTRSIQTREKSINDGTVTLHLSRPDGSETDQRRVNYTSINCPQSTVTPSPTPRTPTPTPTRPPRPTRVPTPTTVLTTTPTPTSVPSFSSVTSTSTSTSESTANVNVIQQPPSPPAQTAVLAAKTVTELPKTGASDLILLNFLSLLPIGMFLRGKAKKLLH